MTPHYDELQVMVYQHAAHLTAAGMKPENALKSACRLAALAFDENTLRKYLRDSADELKVPTTLADLPRDRAVQQGGASLALTKVNHEK